jgi:hypothetical protein
VTSEATIGQVIALIDELAHQALRNILAVRLVAGWNFVGTFATPSGFFL